MKMNNEYINFDGGIIFGAAKYLYYFLILPSASMPLVSVNMRQERRNHEIDNSYSSNTILYGRAVYRFSKKINQRP